MVLASSVSLTEKAFSNWVVKLGTTSDFNALRLLRVRSMRTF